MGPIPLLSSSGLTVLTRSLDSAGEQPILRRLRAFHQRFPQCRINVLFSRFPEEFPPATHLFWLFNSGRLSEAGHIRGSNHDILIGIDPARRTAGLIIGYGLEPFLNQSALDEILNSATPVFKEGKLGDGVIDIIDRLDRLMEDVCRELPAMLGLEKELTVASSSNDF